MTSATAPTEMATLPRRAPLALLVLLTLLAAVPPVLLARAVLQNWVNVPVSDEWSTGSGLVVAKARTHALRPADLWMQHTESRPLFPRLIALALAGGGGEWDVRRGMAVNLLLAAAMSALLFSLLGQARRPGETGPPPAAERAAAMVAMNALLFSPVAWEIWLLGFGYLVLLPLLFLLLALRVQLSRMSLRTRAVAGAALAFAGTFSFSNGLLLWPLLWPAADLDPAGPPSAREKWLARGIYGLGAAAGLLCYLWGYRPTDPAALAYALGHPLLAVGYFLTWCAGPLLPGSTTSTAHLLLGAAWVAAFAAGAGFVVRRAVRETGGNGRALRRAAYPWVMLGLFALGSGGLAALGRAQTGLAYALSSRYAVTAAQLCIAVLGLGFVLWRFQLPAWSRTARTVAAGALLISIVALHPRAFAHGSAAMRDAREAREQARDALAFVDVAPDNFQFRSIYPPDDLRTGSLPHFFHLLSDAGLLRVPTAPARVAAAVSRAPDPADQGAAGSFDVCAPMHHGQLVVSGWATDPAAPPGSRPASFVLFTAATLDAAGQPQAAPRPFTLLRVNLPRPDVAGALKNPALTACGFSGGIPRPYPPAGNPDAQRTVRIAAWAVDPVTGQTRQLSRSFDVPLEPGS